MARFFFDTHNAGGVPWDDEGTECEGRQEIEARARELAVSASKARSMTDVPVMVSVTDTSQMLVMTATLRDKEMGFEWSQPAHT